MQGDHNGDELDWRTYKALAQVVKDKRTALIAEREDESCPEWKKGQLLAQQLVCSDIHAAMLEVMIPSADSGESKKES